MFVCMRFEHLHFCCVPVSVPFVDRANPLGGFQLLALTLKYWQQPYSQSKSEISETLTKINENAADFLIDVVSEPIGLFINSSVFHADLLKSKRSRAHLLVYENKHLAYAQKPRPIHGMAFLFCHCHFSINFIANILLSSA